MKAVMLSLLLLLVICSNVECKDRFEVSEYERSFTNWMHDNSRSYTAADFVPRYNIFKSNMDLVDEHNSRANETYKLGLNKYADLNVDEFRNLLLKSSFHTPRDVSIHEFSGEGVHHARAGGVDWRTSNAVTGVKDQGQCGCCWAFSSTASIESIYKIKTGNSVLLSEQNVLDCEPTSYGCNGGDPQQALQYVVSNKGIATAASYPYEQQKATTCRYNTAIKGADIDDSMFVAQGSEVSLLAAVNNQPVSAAIHATANFQLYKSGVFNDDACKSSINDLNHAVLVIGYDTGSSGDYWIIKNSWGTTWGMSGFGYVARNANNKCGLATYASFPTRVSSSPVATSSGSTTGKGSTTTISTVTTTATTGTKTTTTTTGGSGTITTSPNVFSESLGAGWSIPTSSGVSGVSVKSGGYTQNGLFATISAGSTFIIQGSLSSTGLSKLNLKMKSSASHTITLTITTTTTTYTVSLSVTAQWSGYTVTANGLSGSNSKITNISFKNTASASRSIVLDDVSFTS